MQYFVERMASYSPSDKPLIELRSQWPLPFLLWFKETKANRTRFCTGSRQQQTKSYWML